MLLNEQYFSLNPLLWKQESSLVYLYKQTTDSCNLKHAEFAQTQIQLLNGTLLLKNTSNPCKQ